MSEIAVRRDAADVMEAVITKGDLARLTPQEKTKYYAEVCRSVGLNPFTRPFEYISLSGKLTLYARREATDQLRKMNGISLQVISREVIGDILTVHVRAQDKTGRTDEDYGSVSIKGLASEALSNQMMKAITKAKRRVTLSISGLGFLDESELEGIPAHERAAPTDTAAQLNAFAGIANRPSSYDDETGEVLVHGDALAALAREVAATGTEPLRNLFRDLTDSQRDELGPAIGSPTTPGPLLMLARQADDETTPTGIPPARGAPRAKETSPEADTAAPAGVRSYDPDTGEVLTAPRERPDPVWQAEFAALVPKPSGDGEQTDWGTYAAAVAYMVGQASKADLASLEVSRHPHLRRMREEAIDQYRTVTAALAARAKALAGGAS